MIFDEPEASSYDLDEAEMFAPAVLGPTVDRLVELADGAPALEFAVGTGRVAIPLAERGVAVSGIDVSEPMLDRLRAKRAAVAASAGDITSTRVEGTFGLRPGGRFVVEVMVPALQKLVPGERCRTDSTAFRYVWPAELDLMAQLAGMELEHRWADWHGSPFTSESPSQVSVWRTAEG